MKNPSLLALPFMFVLISCGHNPDNHAHNETTHHEETPKTEVPPTLTPYSEGQLWGYKTEAGEIAIAAKYQAAMDFNDKGIATVIDDAGWAYINRQDELLVRPFIFDNGPDAFQEGLARFVENEKYGFFDQSGKIIIAASYAFAEPFKEGKARVCVGCTKQMDGEHFTMTGGQWHQIDKQGNKQE